MPWMQNLRLSLFSKRLPARNGKLEMSLYENINKKKKSGTSRTKKKSTISPKAYADMKSGFPNSKKNKAKKKKAKKA